VRLRNISLPEEAKELDKELRAIVKEKDTAIRTQDFEKAGSLRDKEMEIKAKVHFYYYHYSYYCQFKDCYFQCYCYYFYHHL
jgi:ATP-dependent Clp protease ATP-binding subunit ClpA